MDGFEELLAEQVRRYPNMYKYQAVTMVTILRYLANDSSN